MGRYSDNKKTQKRIRASKVYADWVLRNRAPACLMCDGTADLHVHHVTELYHILLGLWKLYGDWEAVFEHCLARHEADLVDNCTLCSDCHDKLHPGRHAAKVVTDEQIALWSVLPRNLDVHFKQGTKSRSGHYVGLVSFQTIIGFGWYILNEGVQDKMIEFDRRNFAKLLGKKPGTSFNKSLADSMNTLVQNNIVLAFMLIDNNYEIHLHPEYLKLIEDSPWYFPLEEAAASRMLVLTLRWFLSFQGKRRGYRISRAKLAGHLSLETTSPVWMDKAVTKALDEISWASLNIQDDIYHFAIRSRGAVPIHSLRGILREAL